MSPAIWSHYELDVDTDGDGAVDVTDTGAGAVPGISLDQVNGYRFMLKFNRAMFPDLVVVQLRVFYSPC